jgi:peptide chain release factor subunit 1
LDVTPAEIRRLVDRDEPLPVTSVYLDTDGARYPRAGDYEARLDAVLRGVRKTADGMEEKAREAVLADADAIARWVRNDFRRGDVRGIGVFASGGTILETVESAIPVRTTARVNERPYVVPLEVLAGRAYHIALVVIERDEARVFRYRVGRVDQYTGLTSDVHRQHDQGGWSQARYQRSIEEEVHQHMKEAADILLRAHEEDPFDCIVLAGPRQSALELKEALHPYLRDLLHGELLSVASSATVGELRARLQEVEQTLVSNRRSKLLQRLAAARGTAERGAWGVRAVVDAVNRKAVEILFVVEGAGDTGFRSASGALALHREDAESFGGPVEEVPDLLDEVIEEAVRAGAGIEMFRDEVRLDGHPVAALLRF